MNGLRLLPKFIILNTKFVIFNKEFIIFNIKLDTCSAVRAGAGTPCSRQSDLKLTLRKRSKEQAASSKQ